MADTQNDSTTNTCTTRHYGVVKWFDKMKGYGFLQQLNTVNDYFVHYTQLQSEKESDTKYLVAGEYVEFSITTSNITKPQANADTSTDQTPSEIASNVTGIMGGPLLYRSQQHQRTSHRRDQSHHRASRQTHRQNDNLVTTPSCTEDVTHTNRYDALQAE